jgi:hypothetical protein
LALVLYPEAQTRGQEELDRVIGVGRLPTFDDQPNLPYIEFLVKETLRYGLVPEQKAILTLHERLDGIQSLRWVRGITPHQHHLLTCTPGIPHVLEKDDVYNGYFIPAGTVVIPNQWCVYGHFALSSCDENVRCDNFYNRQMLYDETEYPEPSVFSPERWILKEGQKEPRHPSKVAFGFGRRCVLTSTGDCTCLFSS